MVVRSSWKPPDDAAVSDRTFKILQELNLAELASDCHRKGTVAFLVDVVLLGDARVLASSSRGLLGDGSTISVCWHVVVPGGAAVVVVFCKMGIDDDGVVGIIIISPSG